jgi:hypothetical protein
MQKRTLKVALLAVLSIVLVFGMSSVALGQTWSDLPDSVTAKYGVTDNQVAAISDGYANGLWKPFQTITRAQFTKLAVAAFNVPLMEPATATFTDVPKGNYYFPYVEGAKAAGIINGTTATTFSPNANITRQQALAIISRYVADAAGYDLATMYTAEEIDGLLAHFGDAASISAELRTEVAFAFDFGITVGDDYGNVNPLANLTRIQGAVMLIRAQAKVPPATWTAAKIELVTPDKSENLVGQTKQVTFKVTTADGHPAIGVLVDFDLLAGGNFYVGNISPQAALTNNFGEVTVSMLSTEPGTERVSATVNGVGTIYTTAYWLVLDEVYLTDPTGETEITDLHVPENNAGDEHEFFARVVVFGPGPLSTSAQDWYNAVAEDALADGDVDAGDGIDVPELGEGLLPDAIEAILDIIGLLDGSWNYAFELALADDDYLPRGLAGINVEWTIFDYAEPDFEEGPNGLIGLGGLVAAQDEEELIPSVGRITDVQLPGTIAADGRSAVGITDASGLSSITIDSSEDGGQTFKTGTTAVQAVATYAGNPYPKQLFNHATHNFLNVHFLDWDDQPGFWAYGLKTWIPHVIGGDDDAPITATYGVSNVGEMEEYVLDLTDVYGNPIPGYTVQWTIQGVGVIKTDDSSSTGIDEAQFDWDVTDANGKAVVWIKSLYPGETVIHAKVTDKYGHEFKTWNVTHDWYRIDEVALGQLDDDGVWEWDSYAENEVNTGHTWIARVSGAKYVHVLLDIDQDGLADDQALLGNRTDLRNSSGYVATMQANTIVWTAKGSGTDVLPGQVFSENSDGSGPLYTRYADIVLEANEFWYDGNDDGIDEVWVGLEGKTVYFFNNIGSGGTPTSNTPLATVVSPTALPEYVGTITSAAQVVTDANGFASVSINSTNKGYQYIYAVADYADNVQVGNPLLPLSWGQLQWDSATKLWEPAAGPEDIKVFSAGTELAPGADWVNRVDEDWDGYEVTPPAQASDDTENLNTHRIAVAVFDQYGNALEGYKVTFEILFQGKASTQDPDTYYPYAHFRDLEDDTTTALEGDETPAHDNPLSPYQDAAVGDLSPNDSNPIWDTGDPVGTGDDDYAWGWTLNHQINFTLDYASAAYADLVLDETYDELYAKSVAAEEDYTDFANIVNIMVYAPNGTRVGHFEVTKQWTLDLPVLSDIVLEVSLDSTNGTDGTWVTSVPGEIEQSFGWIRARLLDQFGNPMDNYDYSADVLKLWADLQGSTADDQIFAAPGTTTDANGYTEAAQITGIAAGTWIIRGWSDTGATIDVIDLTPPPGEVRSAPMTLVFTGP